jgi:hypothetical protein
MGIIGWIIFGLIVGAVAKFLMPGRVDCDHPLGYYARPYSLS